MGEILKKICLLCGEEFITNRNNSKYCSNVCRYNSMSTHLNPLRKRRLINCKECNKEFEIQNYTKTQFCSISCSTKNQHKNKITVLNKKTLLCKHCGKEYSVWNYQKNSKFCSNECKHLSGRLNKKCNFCGKEYVSSIWEDDGYCSNKCKSKFIGKRTSKFEKEIFDFLKLKINSLFLSNSKVTDFYFSIFLSSVK